jgi:hypothetical protein
MVAFGEWSFGEWSPSGISRSEIGRHWLSGYQWYPVCQLLETAGILVAIVEFVDIL